ncbi:Ku protein [Streptomyces sp. NPDC053367]|uniref:Ku protein n=1 Tax=Streptomyces sp. NPDC053367 TaxID=3365700 RepID=UPI0037D53FD4
MGEGYYLAPAQQVAAKPYKLLAQAQAQALGRSAKVAIAKYAWSGRERLGLLRVRDDVIVLHAMRWPDEIRDPSELYPPPVEVTDEEIDGALALMDTMAIGDLAEGGFRDAYTDALEEVIDAKREHRAPPAAPEPEQPGAVLDLMSALQESVQKAKASRGETGSPADVHELPPKKTAKKAPARKTTEKKQPAKKTSGRRPRSA